MQTPRFHQSPRGSALLIVLSITLIIAAIATAMFFSARVEGQTSRAFRERMRAQLAAEEGVEIARALLASAFDNSQNQVATMPGRLMVRRPDATEWEQVELSTGAASSGANINRIVRSGDGQRLLDPLGLDMFVNWVWVRKSGQRVVQAEAPSFNAQDPLVARYAFWVDDEATKVNLNTAHRRMDNGYVPAQIDIASVNEDISASDANLIFSKSKQRPLQSVREVARIVDGDVAEAVMRSRLAFTHFNRSANLNPWGDPKIILTTQLDNLPASIRNLPAEERELYFLDILTNADGSVDPGRASSINFTKLTKVLNRLNASLSRTDWPLAPGKSFRSKYKPYGGESNPRITQLALDIIQHVCSAESSRPAVAQIRGRWNGANFVSGTSQEDIFVSNGRTPLITEVSAWVSAQRTGADGSYEFQVRFELYLPPNYGVQSIDLTEYKFLIQATGSTIFQATAITPSHVNPTILQAGGYAVITTPIVPLKTVPTETAPGGTPFTDANVARMYLRVVLLNSFNDFLDQATVGNRDASLGTNDPSGIEYPLVRPAPTAPTLNEMPSSEVDDPRMNNSRLGWIRRSSGNSFGAPNSNWKQSPAATDGLMQDKDGEAFSEFSLSMPGPKGSANNPLGRVTSVGDLGKVPTGIETHGAFKDKNVPWRTLRFQPTNQGDDELPDWMLLELFAAPVVPEPEKEPIYFTGRDLVAGRLNVNTALQPFVDINKTETLGALFGNKNHPAIGNVLSRTRASGGRVFGGSDFLALPGELAEIAGISDSGEKSEEVFRDVITQVTTASRTFSILSIGESLSQSPNGTLTVTSNRSVETLVAPAPNSTPLIFRPISWQMHPL